MENFKTLTYRNANFEVGDMGTILKDGHPAHIIVSPDGYLKVSVPGGRNIGIHRLVAMCWVPNDDPEVKVEVNHKDYCRTNNRAANLEWMSHADNVRYSAWRKNIRGEKNPNYGNTKLSQFYKANPDIAREKQSRSGLRNGRCRKISVYQDKECLGHFDYIEDCCRYIQKSFSPSATLAGIRGKIDASIRKKSTYKGLSFVKE